MAEKNIERNLEKQLEKLRERLVVVKDAATKELISKHIQKCEAHIAQMARLMKEADQLLKDTEPEVSRKATKGEKTENKEKGKHVEISQSEVVHLSEPSPAVKEYGLQEVHGQQVDSKLLTKVVIDQMKNAVETLTKASNHTSAIPIVLFWNEIQRFAAGLTETTILQALAAIESEHLKTVGVRTPVTSLERMREDLNPLIFVRSTSLPGELYGMQRRPDETLKKFLKRTHNLAEVAVLTRTLSERQVVHHLCSRSALGTKWVQENSLLFLELQKLCSRAEVQKLLLTYQVPEVV